MQAPTKSLGLGPLAYSYCIFRVHTHYHADMEYGLASLHLCTQNLQAKTLP
jgi:hypothetical protein